MEFAFLTNMRTLAIASVLVASAALWAQSHAGWGGAGWFHVGYGAFSGFGPFRDALKPSQLDYPASTGTVVLGGGGGGYLGRVFVGGKGEGFLGNRLRGGMGLFSLGFFWRLGDRVVVYPAVGVGAAGYSLQVSGRPSEASFAQAIDTTGGLPPRSFSIGGLVGEASVTVQYFTSKRLLLGLQVGYLRGLGSENGWSAAGITLKNGPSVTPQAFSVRLLVGGGGLSQRGE